LFFNIPQLILLEKHEREKSGRQGEEEGGRKREREGTTTSEREKLLVVAASPYLKNSRVPLFLLLLILGYGNI